jgi:hypothetical protein
VTDAELIARYHQLDDHVTAQTKIFQKYLEPYNKEMNAIKDKLLELLNARGADNTKTEFGTAYKSVIDTPKIEDQEKYLNFCLDHWDTIGNEMLQIGAPKKDAVRHYMDTNGGHLPPHVTMTSFTRLNIRRS